VEQVLEENHAADPREFGGNQEDAYLRGEVKVGEDDHDGGVVHPRGEGKGNPIAPRGARKQPPSEYVVPEKQHDCNQKKYERLSGVRQSEL
jgi:hypothetical protein